MNLRTLTAAPPRYASCVESSGLPELNYALRILVADDDHLIRQFVSLALAADGFAVNAAADGEQAWEALRHEHFDLLVTDNEMPRLAGIKLIERIRDAGMSLPIIVASGSLSVKKVDANPQLQIAAVLPKPFDLFALVDTVRHALRTSSEAASGGHGIFHKLHTSPQPIG